MNGPIVTAVSGTPRDADTLALGELLASALALDLVVATVSPPRPAGARPVPKQVAEARKAGLATIEHALEGAGRADIHAGKMVQLDWSPARGLCELTEAVSASLLVVGSSHRGTAGRVLAGTVGIDVLSDTACPVAFAPVGFADRESPPLARIGVGYDGKPQSERVADYGAALARKLDARLRIITLTNPLQPVSLAHGGDRSRIRQALNEAVRARSRGTLVEAHMIETTGARLTDDREVGLMVVGSHRRGRLARFLSGSVSAETVRTSECPVIVVPYDVAPADASARDATAITH